MNAIVIELLQSLKESDALQMLKLYHPRRLAQGLALGKDDRGINFYEVILYILI